MRCPLCNAKVSLFDKTLNKDGKCPQCGKAIKIATNWKTLILILFPLMFLKVLIERTYFPDSSPVWLFVIPVVVAMWFSLILKENPKDRSGR